MVPDYHCLESKMKVIVWMGIHGCEIRVPNTQLLLSNGKLMDGIGPHQRPVDELNLEDTDVATLRSEWGDADLLSWLPETTPLVVYESNLCDPEGIVLVMVDTNDLGDAG